MLRNSYSPANAEEALWLELEHLKRSAYPSIRHFHQAFMDKARLLGLHRGSEVRGSRLCAIYKGHMKKEEKSTLRAVMMVMSHSGQSVTLDQAMRVAEDTELETAGKKHNPGNSALAPTSSVPAPGPSTDGTVPMDFTATLGANVGQCLDCKGYGHYASRCSSDKGYREGGISEVMVDAVDAEAETVDKDTVDTVGAVEGTVAMAASSTRPVWAATLALGAHILPSHDDSSGHARSRV